MIFPISFLFISLFHLLPLLFSRKTSVYYGNWKAYARDFPLCQVPFEKIDRLFYVFTDPTSGKCLLADDYLDLYKLQPFDGSCNSHLQDANSSLKGNMYTLKVIKEKYPHLQVFFVIGGYTFTPAMQEYVMTNDTEKMQGFVKSCVDLYNNYSFAFDGVDIDYEYPCLYNDSNCADNLVAQYNEPELFVKFVGEFKKQLGINVSLSLATSAEPKKIDALLFPELNQIVDIYNIMTYDFTSGSQGDAFTGHHTCPYADNEDPVVNRRVMSAENAGKYYVNKGANKGKINIGVAFYGRGFAISNESSGDQPINSAFFQSLGGIDFGTWEVGMLDYYDIMRNYSNILEDLSAKAPFIVDFVKGVFITFDSVESIRQKAIIVEENEFQGLFAYELSGDDKNFTLLNAMNVAVGPFRTNYVGKFEGFCKGLAIFLVILMIIFNI